MPDVFAVDGDVDDGSLLLARMPLSSDLIHHALVPDAYGFAVHDGLHPEAGEFLSVFDRAVVGLAGIGQPQRVCDRMLRISLDVGSHVEEFGLRDLLRVHRNDFELPLSECARLIHHDDTRIGEGLQEVGTLYEDALSAGASDAGKKA